MKSTLFKSVLASGQEVHNTAVRKDVSLMGAVVSSCEHLRSSIKELTCDGVD